MLLFKPNSRTLWVYAFSALVSIGGLVLPASGQERVEQRSTDLRSAIRSIEKSSGFKFTFRDALVSGKVIRRPGREEDLNEFLERLQSVGVASTVDSSRMQVLLFQNTEASYEESLVASGIVTDAESRDELGYATISWTTSTGIDGLAVQADGTFELSGSEFASLTDSTSLTFSFLGYESRTVVFSRLASRRDYNIALTPVRTLAPTVVVSDYVIESDLDSAFVRMVDPHLASPLGEANVVRSLQTLPSVSISNGLSTGLNVRGSRADGFQVLLDGLPIYNQSHFFGMFDALNEDALKTVGLYYGITPSQYQAPPGGTISFVTRSGSPSRVEQVYGFSNTSGKLTIGGPVPGSRSSWIVSLRRSFVNEIDWFNNGRLIEQGLNVNRETSVEETVQTPRMTVIPGASSASYYDIHGKASVELSARSRLVVSGYSGGDDSSHDAQRLRLLPSDESGPRAGLVDVKTRYKWGSSASGVQVFHLSKSNLLFLTRAGLSRFNGDYSKDDFAYVIPPPEDNPNGSRTILLDTLANTNELDHLSISQQVTVPVVKGSITAGATANWFRTNFVEDSAVRARVFDDETSATLSEAFVEFSSSRTRGFSVQAGGRLHHLSDGDFLNLSPRIRAQFASRQISVYSGYSRNFQHLHRLYVENTVGSYFWTTSSSEEPPGRADNVVAGVTLRPAPSMAIQLDGYLKQFENLRQHETVVSRRRLRDDGAVLSPWVHDTSGDSRGIEVMVRNQLGPISLTNSYARTRTLINNRSIQDGRSFPADWDRPHQYSGRVAVTLPAGGSLHATFNIASGVPNVLAFSDDLESDRLGVYHRLDIGAEFRKSVRKATYQLRIGIYNLYDRNNAWYRTSVGVLESRPLRDVIRQVNADVYDLGIQPSFEFKVRL